MAWTTLSLLKLEELYYPLKSKRDQLITAVPFHALGVLLAHQGYDDIPLLLGHLGGDGQQHQHVVALGHAHRVQVAQHVGASDLAWKSNEPFLRHNEARFGVFIPEIAARKKLTFVLLTIPVRNLHDFFLTMAINLYILARIGETRHGLEWKNYHFCLANNSRASTYLQFSLSGPRRE